MRATHAGALQLGDLRISCAVLEDGTRVINQSTMLSALGRSSRPRGGDDGTVLFAGNLRPYIPPKLAKALARPIPYTLPGGGRAEGTPANLLPEICEVYLNARMDGRLLRAQERAAQAAEILVRGLARVGIDALIDEATGYQEVRARDELQRLLEAYVQAELRPWVKTFPDEFFRQVYRLQGWEYRPGTSKRSRLVGHLINHYVYNALPEGVLDELRRLNPRLRPGGYRAHKHHQHLTTDTGNIHLDRQISTVTTLMRIAESRDEFDALFKKAFAPKVERPVVVVSEIAEGRPLQLSLPSAL
jgi:hypothetical protein